MLGMPNPTPYDLCFRVAGIPVRVNPWFWVVMALLSGSAREPTGILIFVACAFVSVLAHELGHGLSSRYLGEEPTAIALYAMGGLCQSRHDRLSRGEQIIVLLCGPGAGFLILGLVLAYARMQYGIAPIDAVEMFLPVGGSLDEILIRLMGHPTFFDVFRSLVFINLMWGILNLFPIWPLDGGQITMAFLGMFNRRNARRWTHIISIVVAGGLTLLAAQGPDKLRALFFVYFGFINYQALQSIRDFARYGDSYGDDGADWWKR
jgi:Zn-dependent protease